MDFPLIVEFRPDAVETQRASRVVQQRGRINWTQWLVWPLLFGLLLMYRRGGVAWSQMGFLYFAMAFLVLLTIGAPWIQQRQLRRAYAESPILREPQRYEFSPEGLTIRGGPAATTLGWDAIQEARETDEFLLLFFARRSAYYIPKKAITVQPVLDALRALLHSALGARAGNVRAASF